MNGDQLQYEIDNAGVPLEQRTDYPYCSFDAEDWAKAFCLQNPQFDIDVARAWFTAALMRGFDEYAMREIRWAASLAEVAFRQESRDWVPARREPWWVRLLKWGVRS